MDGFQEQYERVKRSAGVAKKLSFVGGEEYKDAILNFCMHSWHLKDWLKHDSNSPLYQTNIDALLNNGFDYIKICQTLCTRVKHLSLSSSYQGERNINIKDNVNSVDITGTVKIFNSEQEAQECDKKTQPKQITNPDFYYNYYVNVKGEDIAASELITHSLKDWEKFFNTYVINGK